MESRPLVSVIIPFHAVEVRFFRQAVDSALAQTYPNREILLVDDGGPEEVRESARLYAGAFGDEVRHLHHEGLANRGVQASRRLGLAAARGELVALLDADDVWLPRKLEEQVARLRSFPRAGMVYGNTLYWHGWTGRPEDERRDWLPRLGFAADTLVEPPGLVPRWLRGRAAVPCTCSVVARRDLLERVRAFDTAFRVYEDQVTYVKVALESPVLVADVCWDRYRQHPGSVSVALGGGGERDGRAAFLDWLEGYLTERGSPHREVWRALRRERWELDHPRLGRAIRLAGRAARPWSRRRGRPPGPG